MKIARFAILIFIFTIPWENAFTISSIGSLSRIIGIVASGFWVLSVFARRSIRKPQIFHIIAFLFVLYNVVSIFWTVNNDLTMARIKTYVQILILIWMLWDLFTTSESFRAGLQAFILGGYVAIASTIYNFLTNRIISEWEFGRYSGAGQNAVELALILSLSIPVAWNLAITTKPRRYANLVKAINFIYIPAAIGAIILTGSRTALIVIIPGLLYIMATMNRLTPAYRFLFTAIAIFAIIKGQTLIPTSTLRRLGTIGDSISAGDLGGRMVLWDKSVSIFQENFIVGIGSGSLHSPDQLGGAAHNTFISVLTELGILGFLLFLALLIIVVHKIMIQSKSYSVLWLAVLTTWLLGVQSLTWEFTKSTWFFLNMIIISAWIYKKSRVHVIDPLTSLEPFIASNISTT